MDRVFGSTDAGGPRMHASNIPLRGFPQKRLRHPLVIVRVWDDHQKSRLLNKRQIKDTCCLVIGAQRIYDGTHARVHQMM